MLAFFEVRAAVGVAVAYGTPVERASAEWLVRRGNGAGKSRTNLALPALVYKFPRNAERR
jgi:hypothetical protein